MILYEKFKYMQGINNMLKKQKKKCFTAFFQQNVIEIINTWNNIILFNESSH